MGVIRIAPVVGCLSNAKAHRKTRKGTNTAIGYGGAIPPTSTRAPGVLYTWQRTGHQVPQIPNTKGGYRITWNPYYERAIPTFYLPGYDDHERATMSTLYMAVLKRDNEGRRFEGLNDGIMRVYAVGFDPEALKDHLRDQWGISPDSWWHNPTEDAWSDMGLENGEVLIFPVVYVPAPYHDGTVYGIATAHIEIGTPVTVRDGLIRGY